MSSIRSFAYQIRDYLNRGRDSDALYALLYDRVHDLDRSMEVSTASTAAAFGRQWTELPEGDYLLSDPWFRENVDRIITSQETLLKPEWFKGKRVLDAGCGNGRWSYGFSKLGAELTCADINDSALNATREAISVFGNPQSFLRSPLEDLGRVLPAEGFDLVWCWGVAHHAVSFNRSLDSLAAAVRPGGVLYLYFYGRDTVTPKAELRTFKERVAYNVLMNDEQRRKFLVRKAHGNESLVHSMHDIYAPLINRRFGLEETRELLHKRGFTDCVQTIDNTEVFVRATRGDVDLSDWTLPAKRPPYWFQGRHL